MRLVLLVEEPSMEALLDELLPRLMPDGNYFVRTFRGTTQLEAAVRGLGNWKVPGDRFLVLRDNDGADCRGRKSGLVAMCPEHRRSETVFRVVCQALEAWLLGDLDAVEAAYGPPGLAERVRNDADLRDPDALAFPADRLARLVGTEQKVDRSARIAKEMDPERNRSQSFQVFVQAVRQIAQGER